MMVGFDRVVNRFYSFIWKKQTYNKVLWSELDSNLLGEIYCRLTSPTDQTRFRAVCKSWLAVHPVSNTTSLAFLPWFIGFSLSIASAHNRLDFILYEPSSRLDATSVHTVSLTKLSIPCPPAWNEINAEVVNNWLFVCTRRTYRSSFYRRNFVLFSPFTKQVIKLPQSDHPLPFKFRRTFSTDPNSPDCVFLLLDAACPNSSTIRIMTYRNIDKEWTATQFERVDEFIPCSCVPIYIQGKFYIVSPFGQVASYDILNGRFRFENIAIDNHLAQNYSSLNYLVFELNGDLMLIYYLGSLKKNNHNIQAKPCIKRFDWSIKVWIPVISLGDQSLFVGKNFWSVQ
ncbi:F-box/kelch-repeat protein At1g57790-like [Apium graveolens]|uniref:F-box/kelch-repeat protein At1g57790-like n=1 Tax=Apium graveolens TaxID=4045 RepID=UPI003D7BF670